MTGDPGESELGEETPFDQGVPLRTNAVDESPVRLGGSRALDDINRELTISENGESVGLLFTGKLAQLVQCHPYSPEFCEVIPALPKGGVKVERISFRAFYKDQPPCPCWAWVSKGGAVCKGNSTPLRN